jgi:hypothetical protein
MIVPKPLCDGQQAVSATNVIAVKSSIIASLPYARIRNSSDAVSSRFRDGLWNVRWYFTDESPR